MDRYVLQKGIKQVSQMFAIGAFDLEPGLKLSGWPPEQKEATKEQRRFFRVPLNKTVLSIYSLLTDLPPFEVIFSQIFDAIPSASDIMFKMGGVEVLLE